MYYKATIEVLIAVESEGEACDAIAEAIRPMLQEFGAVDSAWIDWRYAPSHPIPVRDSGKDFEYAVIDTAAFRGGTL